MYTTLLPLKRKSKGFLDGHVKLDQIFFSVDRVYYYKEKAINKLCKFVEIKVVFHDCNKALCPLSFFFFDRKALGPFYTFVKLELSSLCPTFSPSGLLTKSILNLFLFSYTLLLFSDNFAFSWDVLSLFHHNDYSEKVNQ